MLDRLFERIQLLLQSEPDPLVVDLQVPVDDEVSKVADSPPIDLGMLRLNGRRQTLSRLGECLQVPHDGILHHLISQEDRSSSDCVPSDPPDALKNVDKVESIVPRIHQSGRASASTRSRMTQWSVSSVATSTFTPNRSCRSSIRPAGNHALVSGPTSTSRSRSLSGPAVPRPTEPKTRTFVAPCCAAMRKISSRCARIASRTAISSTGYHD